MKYWLVKSEPYKWSWDDQMNAKNKTTCWDGVRNHQAKNNMIAMTKGDRAFFYHSNEGKDIVGIVEVVKEYYPDDTDETGKFGMVDFKAVKAMPAPVTLKQIKDEKSLEDMALIRQSRLSVSPVRAKEWQKICKMGGL